MTAQAERGLLTVKETAATLRMSEKWVYRNAAELGAMKFGSSLRFDPIRILDYKRKRKVSN